MQITREQYEADIRAAKAQALRKASEMLDVMPLGDPATVRYLRARADELGQL